MPWEMLGQLSAENLAILSSIYVSAWMYFVILLLSGDIETNPGPLTLFKGSIISPQLTSKVDAIVNAGKIHPIDINSYSFLFLIKAEGLMYSPKSEIHRQPVGVW